jgi:hypothetical protein
MSATILCILAASDGTCARPIQILLLKVCECYINEMAVFLVIIHHPEFIAAYDISEAGNCSRLQVQPTYSVGPD